MMRAFQAALVLVVAAACGGPPSSKGSNNGVVIITNNDPDNATQNNSTLTECGPGRTLCAGTCIDVTLDGENCGRCNNICADGTVCSESACVQVPTDCRVEGECPARYFCDEGTGLCEVGCSTNADCPAGSFCELESHACLCTEAGSVVCGSECVPESPLSCGVSCETCPPLANGTAVCTDGVCGQECNDAHMMCEGACAACPAGAGVISVGCLGAQCVASECEPGHEICDGTCAPCPATTGDETLGCDGAECIITDCTPGTRLCQGVCAACPDDPNGQTTCQGAQCVLVCSGGYHSCGDYCALDGDPDNCGPNCTFCSSDPNGSAVCGNNGQCALDCADGYRECQAACAACPSGPGVVSTTCSSATCVVATCAAGYQACTGGCCQPAPDGIAFDDTAAFSDLSIALDTRGYPHVGTGSATSNTVTYVYWDGSAWQNEFVMSGWAADIELDVMERPHLAIWKRNPDELYYALRGASGWQTEVADTSFNDVGMTPDLELVGNNPHIAYFDLSQDNLRYARKSATTWTDGPILSTDEVGFSPAFVIANGTYHVVYRDETNDWMRYSWGDGNNWNHEVIEMLDSGNYSDIVASSNGTVHLAYVVDEFPDPSQVYYRSRPANGNWSAPTFVGEGDRPSIVLAGTQPLVVYYKPNGTGLRYASAANGWTEATLDAASNVGEENDAAYDSAAGRVHVVYSDFTNRDVLYRSFEP